MASSAPAAQVPAQAQPDGTSDYKPARGKGYDMKKPHITEQPITLKNWYKHVNWLNVTFIIIVPLLGLWVSLLAAAQKDRITNLENQDFHLLGATPI